MTADYLDAQSSLCGDLHGSADFLLNEHSEDLSECGNMRIYEDILKFRDLRKFGDSGKFGDVRKCGNSKKHGYSDGKKGSSILHGMLSGHVGKKSMQGLLSENCVVENEKLDYTRFLADSNFEDYGDGRSREGTRF